MVEELFILKINEYEEFDAILNCVKENGDHIQLRARGFFKEKSQNILKFKEFSFLITDYIESKNNDYKNWGLLKTGEIKFEFEIDSKDDLKFKLFLQNLLLQNYQNIKKNNFHLIKEILKYKNMKIFNNEILLMYFLTKNLLLLNIKPVINKCVNCKTTKNIKTFSFIENGLICKNCFDNKRHFDMNLNSLKMIINFFSINNTKDLVKINYTVEQKINLKEMLLDFYKNDLGYFI